MYQSAPRSQADLKYHNLKLIYDIMKKDGPLSRAELAKRTGLSATSMTRIVNQLIEGSLVAEHSVAAAGGLGRPGTLLSICSDAGFCLCADAIMNRSKVSLVDLSGKMLAYREIFVPVGLSFEEFTNELKLLLPELMNEAGVKENKLICCGVSISGHVIHKSGRIAASSQFEWTDVPAVDILKNAFGVGACIENDCKASLIGEEELLSSEERHASNMVYIKLGYGGVGSAAMVDGHLLRGSRNAAGEIGHFSAQPEGDAQTLVRKSSLENMISEIAVIERAQGINPSYGSIERINAGIMANDAALIQMMDEISEHIAIAVSEVSGAYNPDTIVLNGNLVTGCKPCYDNLLKHLKKRLTKSLQPNLNVRLSKMGSNAGLHGIACITVDSAIERLIMKTEAY